MSDLKSLSSREAYRSGVQFEVLGPLRVLVDEKELQPGGPKQRSVLALLLANANRAGLDRSDHRRGMGGRPTRSGTPHRPGLCFEPSFGSSGDDRASG